MRKRFTIGVLLGNAHTSHPKGLIKGICNRVHSEDVKVVFFLGTQTNIFYREMLREDYDYQYNTIYDYAMLGKIDALIIAYGSLCIFREDSSLEEFLSRFGDIPYVLLEDIVPNGRGVHLIADNAGGIRLCVEHLYTKHHCRNICYLSGPKGNQDAMERLASYRDTMEEYGLTVTPEMIEYGTFSGDVEVQVERLLDNNPNLEAIVSANDEMTSGIYKVFKRRGLVAGKDVLITGFDNSDMSRYAVPPLTTVTQDGYRMGWEAIGMALDICCSREVSSRRLMGELVIRESCGCRTEQKRMERSVEKGRDSDLIDIIEDLNSFQRKIWMVPFITRDLMAETDSEKNFFAKAAQCFHSVGAKNLYIYVLKKPLAYHKGEEWRCPTELYLAASCIDGEIVSYERRERPLADYETLWQEQGEVRNSDPQEKGHVFMNFLLYEGVRQYGVLSAEIEPEAISYFFVMALLFGTTLRFLEVGQKERASRRKLKEQNEMLSVVASFDELTGINNRRGLMEELIQFHHKHRGHRAYFLIGDLDHLKQINDTYGHVEGDCAIRTVAGILKEGLDKGGILGRFGGDEFVAIFLQEDGNEKERYISKILAGCREYNENAGKPYYVDISVGVTEFVCGERTDIKEMLQQADESLYRAKKHRRKSVRKEGN